MKALRRSSTSSSSNPPTSSSPTSSWIHFRSLLIVASSPAPDRHLSADHLLEEAALNHRGLGGKENKFFLIGIGTIFLHQKENFAMAASSFLRKSEVGELIQASDLKFGLSSLESV